MTTCIAKNTVNILQRYVTGKVKYRLNDKYVEFVIEGGVLTTWHYKISKDVLLSDFNKGKSSTALAFDIYNCYKSYITKLFFK